MLTLSRTTIEQLVFEEAAVWPLLENHRRLLQQWRIGRQAGLDFLSRNAILYLLYALTPHDLDRLAEYFGEAVVVQRFTVSQATLFCQELHEYLEQTAEVQEANLSLSREADLLYLSAWR